MIQWPVLLAVTPQDGLLAVAAVFAALGIIGGGMLKTFRLMQRVDATIGVDREGHTLADNVHRATEALTGLDTRVATLESALIPHDGLPLVKRVDLVENDLRGLRAHVDGVGVKVDTLTELLRGDITNRRRRTDET